MIMVVGLLQLIIELPNHGLLVLNHIDHFPDLIGLLIYYHFELFVVHLYIYIK